MDLMCNRRRRGRRNQRRSPVRVRGGRARPEQISSALGQQAEVAGTLTYFAFGPRAEAYHIRGLGAARNLPFRPSELVEVAMHLHSSPQSAVCPPRDGPAEGRVQLFCDAAAAGFLRAQRGCRKKCSKMNEVAEDFLGSLPFLENNWRRN